MVSVLLDVGLILLSLATLSMVIRIIMGPTLPDRVIAADGATTHVIALVVLVGMKLESMHFLDIAIALAVLSFFSSVMVGRYLAKGRVIDGDAD